MNVSILVPVFNEEANLPELLERLLKTARGTGKSFEIILIDDGSSDGSVKIIKDATKGNPELKLIRFNRNYGQHSALFAGFAEAQGDIVVTLDADLQNPPEEIPKLIAKMEEGFEVVGGYRQHRQDSFFRKIPSYFVAKFTSKFVKVSLKDYGCMLRAYRKELVKEMVAGGEAAVYIPALANSLASSVAEIPVEHRAREKGKSKYSFLRLLHLNFDLMTGFSLLPIQIVGLAGVGIAFAGLVFSIFLLVMRLIMGSEWAVGGVFTLFGILFFFVGLEILAIGLIGEYVGRIYQEVRKRPRYRIREIITSKDLK
ncbi:MAG: UDP-4-amino-4-deoxy-L-arabinose-oxoglutarate aminotransferase [Elusimicrobia bacterium RIFCSPLOWO2_01_FULL_54_10]|nr:MAG: UDP-4-amino-4-deoxy-L-arabinose-oxoglutarate aminotransferase [Elusimicrobia bacterium RIFCSPLOWO2_01_FULL_54_10]